MKKTPIFALTALSISAHAQTFDAFDCVFNLARLPQTQTVRLQQHIVAPRQKMNYPSDHKNQRVVTQSVLPIEVFLGWEKFNAKIIHRQAVELNGQGEPLRAAHWQCFTSELETWDGRYSNECADINERNDPFEENQDRWIPGRLLNGRPVLPESEVLSGSINASDDSLTLACTYVRSFESR